MASIRKLPSGKYQAIIRLKGLRPIIRSFTTKTKARDFARQVEGDTEIARKLGAPVAEVITLKQAIELFMKQYKGKDLSVAGRLDRFKEDLGEKPVTLVDPLDITRVLNTIAARRSGATVSRYKSNVSSLFRWLIQHPEYEALRLKNPALDEAVPSYGQSKVKDRFLSEDEQRRLLAACRAHHYDRMYLAVLLLLTTGARRGEVLGLHWQDVDFKDRLARLATTKNGKPRLLPLTKPAIEELMRFRSNPEHRLFPGRHGHGRPREIKHDWRAVCAAAGIEHCRIHDLRHTAASNAIRAGYSLFQVGTLLGHSSPSVTARYSHIAIAETAALVDKVAGDLR